MPNPSTPQNVTRGMRLLVIVAITVLAWWSQRAPTNVQSTSEPAPSSPPPVASRTESPSPAPADEGKSADTVIRGVTLRDQSGRVVYRGDMDLQPVIDRIAAGKRLVEFSHDGSTFQNRERRLPRKSSGYYREYVVPTPGVRGPGPQRLIVGEAGEVYYTSDHYKTFRHIR